MNARTRILLPLWVGLVMAGAVALLIAAGLPPLSRPLIFWLVACVAGEVLWVRLPMGAATISMASCFNFAALLVLPAREAVIAAGLATVIGELVIMRKPAVRALFNAAQTALAVALARFGFDAAGGAGPTTLELVSSLRLLPFLAGAIAYYAVNRGAVIVVVWLAEGISLAASWRRNFGNVYDLLSTGAAFSLGVLLATHYASIGMVGTLFVALPLVLACDGYRRFTRDSGAPESEQTEDRRAA